MKKRPSTFWKPQHFRWHIGALLTRRVYPFHLKPFLQAHSFHTTPHPTPWHSKKNVIFHQKPTPSTAMQVFTSLFFIRLAFRILKPWLQGDFELQCTSWCFYWTLRDRSLKKAQTVTTCIQHNYTWTRSSGIFYNGKVELTLSLNTKTAEANMSELTYAVVGSDWLPSFFSRFYVKTCYSLKGMKHHLGDGRN
jgi:hypothetical protein